MVLIKKEVRSGTFIFLDWGSPSIHSPQATAVYAREQRTTSGCLIRYTVLADMQPTLGWFIVGAEASSTQRHFDLGAPKAATKTKLPDHGGRLHVTSGYSLWAVASVPLDRAPSRQRSSATALLASSILCLLRGPLSDYILCKHKSLLNIFIPYWCIIL